MRINWMQLAVSHSISCVAYSCEYLSIPFRDNLSVCHAFLSHNGNLISFSDEKSETNATWPCSIVDGIMMLEIK